MSYIINSLRGITSVLILAVMFTACSDNTEQKEEQINIAEASGDADSLNSVQGNVALNQIASNPNSVILTGLLDHKLVTVYKNRQKSKESNKSYSGYYEGEYYNTYEHFMPGIDIMYGYNLLNIAHYDLKAEKLNFLFNSPALINTVYYPSFTPDSLDKKPINRDFYLVSVYDEDTNNDTLINRKDLRRFYHFDASASTKTQIIPADYSAVRSQYDAKNDVMYIFARQDANKNGLINKEESLHIFWIDLKKPEKAKRLY